MHDIGRGRFNYMGDFIASMNKGPVKVDFGKDAKPISEKQKAIDELNERNLKMIQRSLTLGSGLAVIACFVGWQFTKWWYGVRDIHGFAEKMSERMPKVSGMFLSLRTSVRCGKCRCFLVWSGAFRGHMCCQ